MKLVPGVHNRELEMIADPQLYPFGVNVTLVYKFDSPYCGVEDTHYNTTEVHWMYNVERVEKFPGADFLSVAIESDIQSDGGTRKLKDIQYITVIPAVKLHTSHHEE